MLRIPREKGEEISIGELFKIGGKIKLARVRAHDPLDLIFNSFSDIAYARE